MVFGIGEGKIELQLNRTQFRPGDTITGSLKLQLNSPKKARRLFVEFYGERHQRYTKSGAGGRKSSSKTTRIFEFSQDLDREKEYRGGEGYDFEVIIPQDVIPKRPEGGLGVAVGAVKFLVGFGSTTKWYVRGALDIPGGLDISKRVQVNVVG